MSAPARRLRLGVLGAGMIATADAGYLPGLAALADRCTVVAIASRTRANAESVAQRFGIPRVFDELQSMLDSGDVDAVINCTPIGVHLETSLAIVRAGMHLISEKPLAGSVEGAELLIRTAEERGVLIVSAPFCMLEPSRRRAAELIASGAIGQLLSARFRVSHAGPAGMPWPADPRPYYVAEAGPLRDLAPYAIEQILTLVGPIHSVTAITSQSREAFPAFGDGPFGGVSVAVESDDTVSLIVEAGERCVITIESSFGPVASLAPSVEFFGTEGTIVLRSRTEDGPRIEMFRRYGDHAETWSDPSDIEDRAEQSRLDQLGRAALVDQLLSALLGMPMVNGQSAAEAVRVIAAAERSARERRTVSLDVAR